MNLQEEGLEKIALLKAEVYSSLHIPPFTPKTHIAVTYGPSIIVLGKSYNKFLVKSMPIIEFYPHTKGYFTVFMVDPDAPNPAFVHLLFVNVEGEKGIKSSISSRKSSSDIGNIVVPYMPPSPPSGVHRYIVLVSYQKNGKISPGEVSHVSRVGVDVASFSDAHNLEGVGLFYFTVSA